VTEEIKQLKEYVESSPSPWHGAYAGSEILKKAGFKELNWGTKWDISSGGRYYTKVYGAMLVAFTIGTEKLNKENSLRIGAAHLDFPGFRIKPAPEIVKDGYGTLNIESYGGAILYSWLDRPLSIAGRVALKGKNAFSPSIQLVDCKEPICTIPSLAIHMNRKVNEGMAFNKQKDILPLAAVLGKEGNKHFFEDFLAQEMHVAKEDILSYELNVYPYEYGYNLGVNKDLYSSPRLDNMTSVVACIEGILAANSSGLNMIVLFDNEEVGSRTKQGAGSVSLMQVLERIYTGLGYSREEMWQGVNGGFMLSADVAHGLHPNYPDKIDPTNKPVLNGGVVIKQAASQSYASDAQGVAVIKYLCQENSIPYQEFVNRGDIPGGATLGSIASAQVPILTADVGVPILAMHSAREIMGTEDQHALNNLLKALFK